MSEREEVASTTQSADGRYAVQWLVVADSEHFYPFDNWRLVDTRSGRTIRWWGRGQASDVRLDRTKRFVVVKLRRDWVLERIDLTRLAEKTDAGSSDPVEEATTRPEPPTKKAKAKAKRAKAKKATAKKARE